ncbi:MAG: hypothetical protein AB7L84_09570 [Acidimicrobiia bacterium]
MAIREKRSISLPPELAQRIERAADAAGLSVSAWLAATAAHRLRIEEGLAGVAAWEREHGALTDAEIAEGLARARTSLARRPRRKAG